MNENEFQKMNRQIKRKQTEAAKARERKSAAKISESCKTLLNDAEERRCNPTCERCHRTDVDLVTVTEGKYSLLCPRCDEQRREWLEIEAKREVRERRARREKQVAWLRDQIEEAIPKAYRKARLHRLGDRFNKTLLRYNRETGLVLVGPTGVGKTYSACALLHSLIASGLVCKRIGYEMLLLSIRSSFKSGSGISELDVIKEYVEADVLLLEDLGCSKPIGSAESNFSLTVIYTLLDSRLENERLTLITTNKTLENMKVSFDERIASRLSVFSWIGVGGRDKRVAGKEI